jgi:TonB family protein
MNRSLRFFVLLLSILIMAERSPAPIVEPTQSPAPAEQPATTTPAPEIKPKSAGPENPQQTTPAPPKPKVIHERSAAAAPSKVSVAPPEATDQSAGSWKRHVVAQPAVVYPQMLKRNGIQGNGIFYLTIDRNDGSVTEVKVLESTGHKELDAVYVMNFFQWKFQPHTITWARIPRGYRITGRRMGHELH